MTFQPMTNAQSLRLQFRYCFLFLLVRTQESLVVRGSVKPIQKGDADTREKQSMKERRVYNGFPKTTTGREDDDLGVINKCHCHMPTTVDSEPFSEE